MGLGKGEGSDGLATGDGGQVAGLLLVGAAQGDGVAAQPLHDEVGVGLGRHPGQLLADDAQVRHPDTEASILLGDGVAQQFRLGQDGHQPAMHHRRLIGLPGDGRDPLLGQPPGAVLQCLLPGGKGKVHGLAPFCGVDTQATPPYATACVSPIRFDGRVGAAFQGGPCFFRAFNDEN